MQLLPEQIFSSRFCAVDMTSPAAMIIHESGGAAYSVVAMIMFQFRRLSFHFLTTASSKSIEALGTQLVHLLPQTGEGCTSVQLRGFLSFKGNVPLDLLGKVSLLLIVTCLRRGSSAYASSHLL